jgi:hypothetical protein
MRGSPPPRILLKDRGLRHSSHCGEARARSRPARAARRSRHTRRGASLARSIGTVQGLARLEVTSGWRSDELAGWLEEIGMRGKTERWRSFVWESRAEHDSALLNAWVRLLRCDAP